MFSEPRVECVDRATDLLGGNGCREMIAEDEVNGVLFDFGGKREARHNL